MFGPLVIKLFHLRILQSVPLMPRTKEDMPNKNNIRICVKRLNHKIFHGLLEAE